jgi:hypothetical protein
VGQHGVDPVGQPRPGRLGLVEDVLPDPGGPGVAGLRLERLSLGRFAQDLRPLGRKGLYELGHRTDPPVQGRVFVEQGFADLALADVEPAARQPLVKPEDRLADHVWKAEVNLGPDGLREAPFHGPRQLVQSFAAVRDDRHDVKPDRLGQSLDVHALAFLLQKVGHRQRDDGRHAGPDDLAKEEEVALKVRGVQDADEHVRDVAAQAANDVRRDLFVERDRPHAVQTGNVDASGGTAAQPPCAADLLDRHSWVVADLLTGAGQRVKEAGFA